MIAEGWTEVDDTGAVTVNLAAMTLEELVEEKHSVQDEIRAIQAQLMEGERRPPSPEDDGPEWVAYRDWRRRARWALVCRKREHGEIQSLLTTRHQERAEENQRRKAEAAYLAPESACHTAEEYIALRASATERRAALLTKLNTEGAPEALVLRLYRALRNLIGDGNEWPDVLDDDDKDAMREASIFLRSRFTTKGVQDFVTGRLSDYQP